MKLKSVLVLLAIVCMNSESNSLVKKLIKGTVAILKVSEIEKGLKILLHDSKYSIIKNEKGIQVFKETIEQGKWVVVVVGVVETEVLHAASALYPCPISDKKKKGYFKDLGLISSESNISICQPIQDVINLNALEDTNKSKIDKLVELGMD